MGVCGVDVLTDGMAHERLADLLHNSCLHESRVKRVAKVMETAVPDTRPANRGFPRGLDNADVLALKREEQTLRSA